MQSSRREMVLLRVRFSDRHDAAPALRELDQDPSLSARVLRGRFTREDARFDPAVTGASRRIRDLLRRGDAWGAGIGGLGNAP